MLSAIILTMLGYLIVTDWQTISYDSCTEFSPFHHPNLTYQNNKGIQHPFFHNKIISKEVYPAIHKHKFSQPPPKVMSINLLSDIAFDQVAGSSSAYHIDSGVTLNCKLAETRSCACGQFPSKCLKLSTGNSEMVPLDDKSTRTDQIFIQCTYKKHPVTVCFILSPMPAEILNSLVTPNLNSDVEKGGNIFPKENDDPVEIDSINVLPEGTHQIARNNCIQANVSGHHCHWIPYSDIFQKECEDCQPICRSVHQTLTFPQFITGCGVLFVSSSFQVVITAALLMNQSPEQIQVYEWNILIVTEIHFSAQETAQ